VSDRMLNDFPVEEAHTATATATEPIVGNAYRCNVDVHCFACLPDFQLGVCVSI
jgi:hypothetical protein